MIERPTTQEYDAYYHTYVEPMLGVDIRRVFDEQVRELRELAAGVDEDREQFAYAPGKWTVRQLMGHLVDGERVFGVRMFRLSRFDDTPMPGYDENRYITNAPYADVPLAELVNEFAVVRQSTTMAMDRFTADQWKFVGDANGSRISARALAYVTVGHVQHHVAMLRERYGV